MNNAITVPTFAALFLLALFGCAKDELTVEKLQGSAPQHSCTRLFVELNIDSLVHCDPWDSTLTIATCSCDTIDLRPTHIPPDLEFERWTIDQDGHISGSTLFNLDTLTLSSHLQIVFEHEPGNFHVQVPVVVQLEQCK